MIFSALSVLSLWYLHWSKFQTFKLWAQKKLIQGLKIKRTSRAQNILKVARETKSGAWHEEWSYNLHLKCFPLFPISLFSSIRWTHFWTTRTYVVLWISINQSAATWFSRLRHNSCKYLEKNNNEITKKSEPMAENLSHIPQRSWKDKK